ncbi:MAG: transcriptional repressor LexA [Clostridia bacterium]|jgi:repressor LexA|nr:transcriptional repressor LexA [Clostridia bacterium]MDD4502230.1 transcriptional repressor LexA [Clostridia bacterium]NLV33186.1 transcriptional repressor LexA [Clostridiaceae bacterium]HQM96223.1 transcriptional repressor LexA [Clostridia bacterium]HQO69861.1 transcriptional repressor LexA [Clostridia bacterium]
MKDYLSIREEQTYEYIRDFIREKGYAPSVRDICKDMNIPSTSTAHSYINKLKRLGYIEKNDSISRSLTLSKQEAVPVVEVPVIGNVAAGTPILAVENIIEYFPVPEAYLKSGVTFMLKVKGDSMIDAGIHNNDMILVKKQEVAYDKDIVVALIDNETTVKTFYRERDRVRLQPENINYEPIYVYKDLQILGKVFGVFRIFN